MALESLPTDFKDKVCKACQEQGLDYDEAIEAIALSVIGDVLAYNIWQGPAPGFPDLSLDVSVLTPVGLFIHEVHPGLASMTGCTFLDAISDIALVKIEDQLAKYVLVMSRFELANSVRIFSDDEGFQSIRAFLGRLIQARDKYVYPHTTT